jgi:hypothetical protein
MSVTHLWPTWAATVGGMIDHGSIVMFRCARCNTFLDVDLAAIAALRGRDYSLVDRPGRCKIIDCRGRGWFFASPGQTTPSRLLRTKAGLARHATPAELGPPRTDLPPPAPPCPPGIDAVRWAYASASERKRMVREARG